MLSPVVPGDTLARGGSWSEANVDSVLPLQWVSIAGAPNGPEHGTLLSVKEISIQDLKGRISSVIADAEAGVTVLITRHRRPVAKLSPAVSDHVHVGARFGRAKLRAVSNTSTHGRYLEVLLDDRRGSDR
jgi:antitoxin (DNA-binding transcriptional repressor) of toxin-antitoxin stability system